MAELEDIKRRYKRTKRLIDVKKGEIREVFAIDIPNDHKQCMQLIRRCEPPLKGLEEKVSLLEQYVQELEGLYGQGGADRKTIETEIDTYTDTREMVMMILHEGLVFVTQLKEQAADLNPNKVHTPQPSDKKENFEEDVSKLIRIYEEQAGTAGQVRRNPKLPQIELPKFSGNVFEWSSFIDLFTSVIYQNADLDDARKLQYLKSLLTGEAAKFVSNISLSNENYNVALNVLKDQYEDTDKVINKIHSKFLSMKTIPNDTEKLREFYADIEGLLRSLEALGETIDHRHYVNTILSKLPRQMVLSLERAKGRQEKWTLEALGKEIQEEIYFRETTDSRIVRPDRKGVDLTSDYEVQSTAEGLLVAGQQRTNVQKHRQYPLQNSNAAGCQRGRAGIGLTPQNQQIRSTGNQQGGRVELQQKRQARCVFCGGNHWTDDCNQYPTVQERRQRLTSLNLCYRCAKAGHVASRCQTTRSCFHCHSVQHHSSICGQRPAEFRQLVQRLGGTNFMISDQQSGQVESRERQDNDTGHSATTTLAHSANRHMFQTEVCLQTATTCVVNPKTRQAAKLRLFFDTGSNRSYIRQQASDRLQLETTKGPGLSINTFMATNDVSMQTHCAKVEIPIMEGSSLELEVIVVPTITNKLRRVVAETPALKQVTKGLRLADSLFSHDTTFEVDVLIGSDYYLDIIQGERIQVSEGLYLLSSRVGWILAGRIENTRNRTRTSNVGMSISLPEEATNLLVNAPEIILQDIWSLERLGITDDPYITDDDEAMEQFRRTITFKQGRYEVGWPWRNNADELPTNYGLAFGRLRSLLTRLQQRPDLKQRCCEIIEQQESTGVIEKVKNERTVNRIHYLPFHPVETPINTTTKVRLVYDASARTAKGGLSLNDCLHRGPVLVENLIGLLLRFRLYPIGVIADIEKAFHQISLLETDRDVTRFLWMKDENKPPDADNLQIYRFRRVGFGMKPSPFLLEATVAHHLQSVGGKIANQIRRDMYVDNLVTGTFTLADALQLYEQGKEIFQKAGMNLREWSTNNRQLQSKLAEMDKGKTDQVKVLGMGSCYRPVTQS